MTLISNGAQSVAPILWMRYRSSREARTIAHTLASGKTALSLRDSAERKVTLVLLFTDEDESMKCEEMHAQKGVLTITEDGRDTHSMKYAVIGPVEREMDEETRKHWFVSAQVIEVTG